MSKSDWQGGERRRKRRFSKAQCELKVLKGPEQVLTVKLKNISLDGIGITAPEKLEVGQRVCLSVAFANEEPIKLVGRIVWCRENGDEFDAGVEFQPPEA